MLETAASVVFFLSPDVSVLSFDFIHSIFHHGLETECLFFLFFSRERLGYFVLGPGFLGGSCGDTMFVRLGVLFFPSLFFSGVLYDIRVFFLEGLWLLPEIGRRRTEKRVTSDT